MFATIIINTFVGEIQRNDQARGCSTRFDGLDDNKSKSLFTTGTWNE
jgi:hypothetical protein